VHCAYYHPFSSLNLGYPTPPFLSTADHYFEWRCKFNPNKVLGTILFSVHPGFHNYLPFNIQVTNPIFQCPSIIVCWWNILTALSGQVCTWVDELGETLRIEEDIWLFKHQLFDLIDRFWKPVYPYNSTSPTLRPPHSPGLPLTLHPLTLHPTTPLVPNK